MPKAGPLFAALIVALCLALFAASAAAQVEFEIEADRSQVVLGETLRLDAKLTAPTLRVSGSPSFASLSGFEIVGRQSSTSLEIINGRASSTLNYVFLLTPRQTGEFSVGPLQIEIRGKTYSSNALRIKVLDTPAQSAVAPQDAADVDAATPANADQPLFLHARVDPPEAVVGQQLVLTFELYTQRNVLDIDPEKYPALAGFLSEEISSPSYLNWERVTIEGRSYRKAVVSREALYPLQTGSLTIDSMVLLVQVPGEGSRGRGFFFGPMGRTMRLASTPLTIEVSEPPAADRPPQYGGAIGPLVLDGSLAKNSVAAHAPVTLTLKLGGEGNYRTLDVPQFELPPDFRIYSAQGREQVQRLGDKARMEKTYEVLLIGERPGNYQIGPIELPYYDPQSGEYRVATAGPFALQITASEEVSQVAPGSRISNGLALRPNRPNADFAKALPGDLLTRPWLLAVLLALPLLNLMVGLWLRRRRRMAGDELGLRRRKAGFEARRRLKRAQRIAAQDPAEFYGELMRALLGLINDRLGLDSKSLTREQVRALLQPRGVDPQLIEQLISVWDRADRARFGGHAPDRSECNAALDQAAELIARLDRSGLRRN
ncbi:MAG: BatD family protein [Candidatus Alcyoniella australis]|nr:BatD family protein [Candidatus Alcyoniella australis]